MLLHGNMICDIIGKKIDLNIQIMHIYIYIYSGEFYLASEPTIKKVKIFERINILEIKIQITTYADDNTISPKVPKRLTKFLL